MLSCGVFGLACALALVQSLWAHAILLEATPAKNAIVSGSPLSVELRFNCRIDGKRSRLSLVLPNQALHPLVIQTQTSPDNSARGTRVSNRVPIGCAGRCWRRTVILPAVKFRL